MAFEGYNEFGDPIPNNLPSAPKAAPTPSAGMAKIPPTVEVIKNVGKAAVLAAGVAAVDQTIKAYDKHEELPENTRIAEAGSEGVAAFGGAGAGTLLGIKAGASLPLPLPARGIAAALLGAAGAFGGQQLIDSTISWAQSKTAGLFGGSDEVAAEATAHAEKVPVVAAKPAEQADKAPAVAAKPAEQADKAPAVAAKPKKSAHHATSTANNHDAAHKKAEHQTHKGDKFTHYMEALAATNDVKGIKIDGILTDNEKQNIETALAGKLETHKGKIVGMNVGAFVHLDEATKSAISVSPSKNADEYNFSVDMNKLPHKQNQSQKHIK